MAPDAQVAQMWEQETVAVPASRHVFAGTDLNVDGLNSTLRAYGDAGWELVAAVPYDLPNNLGTLLFFKRPKAFHLQAIEPAQVEPSLPVETDGMVVCQGCGDRISPADAILRVTGALCPACHAGTRFAKPVETMQVVHEDPYRGTRVEVAEKRGPCARCGKEVLASQAYRSSHGSICRACQANEE